MAASDVISGGLQGGMAGASAGSAAGPWGAVIGGVVGTIGGAILGGQKKKMKAPKRASGAVYGYDAYGNLVNKGTFQYNKSTGQYELTGGELSDQEKMMRRSLADNIASLINTVGSDPDAFVRYAKELSDTYYRQGERQLTEAYGKAQARLDESLAKRGMSTSRAAADLASELQGQRMDTLANIYDAAQRYGYQTQSGMQAQAQSALGTLAGYQNALSAIDQSYLSKALTAQQIGQQYENMKAGYKNQQIAAENQGWQDVLDSMTSLGGMIGYAGAAKGAAGAASSAGNSGWMTQGTNMALNQDLGIGQSYTPQVNTSYSTIFPSESQNKLGLFYGGYYG